MQVAFWVFSTFERVIVTDPGDIAVTFPSEIVAISGLLLLQIKSLFSKFDGETEAKIKSVSPTYKDIEDFSKEIDVIVTLGDSVGVS